MNLLFLGAGSGTAKHRADALRRLGHTVHQVDPDELAPQGRLASRLHWETGGLLSEKPVTSQVLAGIEQLSFDLTWVDNGRNVGPLLVRELQRRHGPVVNYNVDDPYVRRDRFAWSLYKKAVPAYNLVVVVREENVAEAKALRAKKVLRVYRSADEVAPQAFEPSFLDHVIGTDYRENVSHTREYKMDWSSQFELIRNFEFTQV